MPTSNRRLHVTLTPTLDATIGRLAKAAGKSRATVIREWLLEAEPFLQEMAAALEEAQTKPRQAVNRIAQIVGDQVGTMVQTALELHAPRKRRRGGSG